MKNLILFFKYFIFFGMTFVLPVNSFSQQLKVLNQPIIIESISSKRQDNGNRIFELRLEIAKDHLLYFDDLLVVSELDSLNNSSFDVEASPIFEFKDKFSNGEIKKGMKKNGLISFKVPFGFNYNSKFKLSYRACTEEFCYLPKTLAFDHGQTETDNISKNTSFSFFNLNLNLNLNFNSTPMSVILLIVFLAGILTSLTPCIFPLIPITLALIRNNVRLGKLKSFLKTFIFIFGIAITYSFLGLIAASSGSFFGSFLANSYVLVFISLIYFTMAISMLGFFEVKFFSNLQNKISNISTDSNLGVLLFGMMTGLFASPCVGPILISILTYAAQTKDLVFSFFMLFIYAIGLGQIFLLLTLFSNLINKLPKSGPWLNGIKYLLSILLFIAGLFFFVPAVKSLTLSKKITYSEQLNLALKSNKIVIVDFKADWCGACKELELKTFKDPLIKSFLDKNMFLPIDVTVTTPDTNELLQKYGVIGLPHVMFFNKSGNLLPEMTISSYISPEELLKKIKSLDQSTN